jgi:hypothetical protein
MDIIEIIKEYITEFEALLKRFHNGSSGLFLSTPDTALLTQKIFEITDILNKQFGNDNRYSINIIHTANTQIGGFPPGPTYKCVQDIIGLLKAAEKYAGLHNNNIESTNEILGTDLMNLPDKKIWIQIENDLGMSKRAFGKKINFVNDDFKRKIIFRDIAQAYILSKSNFSKPAVILAGSIIEELLRLYLDYKKVKPTDNTFNEYINTCNANGFLKSGISKLSHSVRYFRNLVHMNNETNSKDTISKATSQNAVSSIFIIANEF